MLHLPSARSAALDRIDQVTELDSRFGRPYLDAMHDLCGAVTRDAAYGQVPLSLCWPYIGSRYDSAEPRTLIVGKAVNGEWEETQIKPGDRAFEALAATCIGDREGRIGRLSGRENWLSGDDGATALRRSPYWRLVRQVHRLAGGKEADEWWRQIAATNLYKVAPLRPPEWQRSGPAMWLTDLQHSPRGSGAVGHAQALLRMEVDELRPNIVVCVTGHRAMHHFWHQPENNPLRLRWSDWGTDWRKQPVHRVARESTSSGERIWIVTQRPEYRTRQELEDIATAIVAVLGGAVAPQHG